MLIVNVPALSPCIIVHVFPKSIHLKALLLFKLNGVYVFFMIPLYNFWPTIGLVNGFSDTNMELLEFIPIVFFFAT